MSHISFSELKNWSKCPFYHKLVHIDKLKGFQGNEYTAFGSAIHDTCENLLLEWQQNKLLTEGKEQERINATKLFFKESFLKQLKQLPQNVEKRANLINQMKDQGTNLIPLIIPAVVEYFGSDCEIISTEEKLLEPIKELEEIDYNFKGFVDIVFRTSDGKYHIVDWKSCSWGWDKNRKSDKMTTYQLTFYKHYFAIKHNIDPANIQTHFGLLKRTAKSNNIEIFKVSNGKIRTGNALSLLKKALCNINSENYIKNRLSCRDCEFYKTKHCT